MSNPFFISLDDATGFENYLENQGWLHSGETLKTIGRAGEGNMNLTLRVKTNFRSIIVKQARPWVEKYPQIAAPPERAWMEAAFYEMIASNSFLRNYMPELLAKDETSFILMLEDLGETGEMFDLYQKDIFIENETLLALLDYLSVLHGFRFEHPFENRPMRELNHAHLFIHPFDEHHGLKFEQFEPGLGETVNRYRADKLLREHAAELGEVYLSKGKVLLHGDFFPGSWLRSPDGVKVIDPEFCFSGMPEFELGILRAHLRLSQQPEQCLKVVDEHYKGMFQLNRALMDGFTGIEIFRRMLGVAQLPLELDLEEKELLLEEAYCLVMKSEKKLVV